ncbi:MAG: hypothetical protein QOI78_2512 [Actinomycetota bacterium]|nr:hypothetical protein [Actinomycetota bacterium]
MVAKPPGPANGSAPVPARTATTPSTAASPVNATASQVPGRESANRCAIRPPASAPRTKPAIAVSEAVADRPERGSALKPRNTTLPVMFATNTWPSRR